MWGLIVRALTWLAPIAVGWTASDVYNESATKGQLNAAGAVTSAKKSILEKWWFYALLLGIFIAFIYLVRMFKLQRYLKSKEL